MNDAPYPPLVPLDDMPLHSGRVSYNATWGCRIGGSIDVHDVIFDWRCRDCASAAAGFVDAGQDIMVDWRWRSDDGIDHGPVLLSWLVQRAFYWLTADSEGVGTP